MKALSICQPWAWLIVAGHKDIENRTWFDRTLVGERLLIHASQTYDRAGMEAAERMGIDLPIVVHNIGAIVGSVVVCGVVRSHASPWFTGPLGWQLRDPIQLKHPISCLGRLKVWTVPPQLHAPLLHSFVYGGSR